MRHFRQGDKEILSPGAPTQQAPPPGARRTRSLGVGVAGLWVLAWIWLEAAAAAAGAEGVLRVGPQGDFPSVSQALQAARGGETILVEPGYYRERLTVDRPVRLVGRPGAVLDGGGEGDVVTIRADGVELSGFVIRGSGRRLWKDEAGIKVLAGGAVIAGNVLEDVLFGILVIGADGQVIRENRITGLVDLQEHDRGDGIRLYNSGRNLVEGNRIVKSRDGIYVEFSSGNRIAGNRVEGARIGLHYMYSDDNLFEENLFTDCGVASAIMYSRGVVVRRNVFARSRGYGAYGLFLKEARSAQVEANLVAANQTGLSLDFAIASTFRGNLVVANDVAVRVLASSADSRFYDNAFVSNGSGVYLSPGRHTLQWDDGVGRGNFWSDYRGYDLDADGVGDVPFDASELFGYLVESYPELKVLFQSPAVMAVAAAERAFPLFARPSAQDRFPLMRMPQDVQAWVHEPASLAAAELSRVSRASGGPGPQGAAAWPATVSAVAAAVGLWAAAVALRPVAPWRRREGAR